MSRVTCHVSHVTCHMLCVTCHMSLFIFIFLPSGKASRWRVCYQQGLPRLVSGTKNVINSINDIDLTTTRKANAV